MCLAGRPFLEEYRQRRTTELKHRPGPEEIPVRRDRRPGLVCAHFRTQAPGAIPLSPPDGRFDIELLAIDDDPALPAAKLRHAGEILLNDAVALAVVLLLLCRRKTGFELERETDAGRIVGEGQAVPLHS